MGITVPDINQACDFFANILGAEVLFTAATDFKGEGDWMAEHLNVHPRAEIKEFRYVRLGNGTNLEVFQFTAPDQKNRCPVKKTVMSAATTWHFMLMTCQQQSSFSRITVSRCWVSLPPTPTDQT